MAKRQYLTESAKLERKLPSCPLYQRTDSFVDSLISLQVDTQPATTATNGQKCYQQMLLQPLRKPVWTTK